MRLMCARNWFQFAPLPFKSLQSPDLAPQLFVCEILIISENKHLLVFCNFCLYTHAIINEQLLCYSVSVYALVTTAMYLTLWTHIP